MNLDPILVVERERSRKKPSNSSALHPRIPSNLSGVAYVAQNAMPSFFWGEKIIAITVVHEDTPSWDFYILNLMYV